MPIDGNKDKFVVNLEFDENNSIKIKRSMGFPFPRNNSILSHHHRFWNGFVYYVGFRIAAAPSFSVLINSKIVNKFNSSETWRHKNLILKWRCWRAGGRCCLADGWHLLFVQQELAEQWWRPPRSGLEGWEGKFSISWLSSIVMENEMNLVLLFGGPRGRLLKLLQLEWL